MSTYGVLPVETMGGKVNVCIVKRAEKGPNKLVKTLSMPGMKPGAPMGMSVSPGLEDALEYAENWAKEWGVGDVSRTIE